MKVFLSWSGDVSQQVAIALHKWLPYVLQRVKPFLSSSDISAGENWVDLLAEELQNTNYGIICVTPYNIRKPWINFEAGALSKFAKQPYITPLLFDIESHDEIKGPLDRFQSAFCTKEGILSLIQSINKSMDNDEKVDDDVLEVTFDIWWNKLEEKLIAIKNSPCRENTTAYKWLYHKKDFQNWGIEDNDKSVWIVASNIFVLPTEIYILDQICNNIKKGLLYRYFMPRGYGMSPYDKESLSKFADENPGKVEIREFDDECFSAQAPADFILISPTYER